MQIIAEIAQAHDGSLGIAHSYIDALSGTGVDAVKFQTHIAEAESSEQEPFRTNFSYEDDRRIDYWKRMEFTKKEWKGLKNHCDEKDVEFLSSPFSNAAVDLLEEVGVKRYKVGSGEVSNFLLLEKIAKTGKPIILSSGMSSFAELDNAVQFLQNFDTELSVMQCTTAYPTTPEQWGLNVLTDLKNRYSLPVGFSDHSGDIYACLAAAALGAQILEFHVVFDKQMFGPDAKASLTINEVKRLVKGVREIDKSLKHQVDKSNNEEFEELKNIFEKSLTVNTDLKKGHVLTFSDLDAKKPKGYGINASEYKNIIGSTLNRDIKKWEFLNYKDIHESS
ncbi:MAG: N-acetylneuraminate synthase family protein [Balneolaceae bacterium]|nr:N-acetylneuraminate synthase family protein [Balneolaceae bacterium]